MNDKCEECKHRINDYCRAYKVKIEIIDIDKCNRRKITESRKERRSKK